MRVVVIFITALFLFYGCNSSEKSISQVNTNEDSASSEYALHNNITVTVFWIGEEASEENGYISNSKSAWDYEWEQHYGGLDDPNNRDGYYPAAFTPKENPFYFALPYNDFDDNGLRKSDVESYIPWASEGNYTSVQSMCKNRWVKIIKNDKIAYAQWEDVGPFGENDYKYVFGTALPENLINNYAGLDVSPAVRDYLDITDVDIVNWQFVNDDEVPEGPWKTIITTSQINWQ